MHVYHIPVNTNWVYALIFLKFNNKPSPNIKEIRDILNNFENGLHKKELIQINDERIKNWVNGAKIAIQKTNKDYIIGFNEQLKKEIQIISSDTGRDNMGQNGVEAFMNLLKLKNG